MIWKICFQIRNSIFDSGILLYIWSIHICYWPARRSVLGKTVPEAVLKTEGTVFPNTDRPRQQIMRLLFSSVEYFVSYSTNRYHNQYLMKVFCCVVSTWKFQFKLMQSWQIAMQGEWCMTIYCNTRIDYQSQNSYLNTICVTTIWI